MEQQTADSLLEEQLPVLDKAAMFILITIAAVTLSFYGVLIQRKQLTDAAAGRETPEACQLFSVQTVSAVLVLAAVLYYFYLTGQAVKGPFDSPCDKKLKSLNHFSNGLVLGAAMIRLYNLFFSRAIASCEGTQEAAEEELENSLPV